MNSFYRLLGLLIFSLVMTTTAYAVGSATGGGDPVPACSADTWECGDWSQCGEDGFQGRTCTLTYDCPSADTPAPFTLRECAAPEPETAPEPVTTSAPATDPAPTPTSTPQPTPTPTPTPQPAPANALGELSDKCAVMDDTRDRIVCRLEREEEAGQANGYGNAVEDDIPEECLTMVDDRESFDACLITYANLRDCWSTYEIGHPQRFTCVSNTLSLTDIPAQKAACSGDSACMDELSGKVYWLVKAYMYDVEERAEQFYMAGAPFDATVDMIVSVLEAKIAFNQAATYEGRLKTMVQLRQDWADYVNDIKSVIE